MLIVPVLSVEFDIVDKLSDTDRGEGGFGSTDNKVA
jgi:dUTPase